MTGGLLIRNRNKKKNRIGIKQKMVIHTEKAGELTNVDITFCNQS